MPDRTPLPKAFCMRCGKTVALRLDGTFRLHKSTKTAYCNGSQKPP